jgi:tRNA A37 threonylcarbamoyladenosine dehydratase
VEALARSGVGRLTLVDFDAVCITNINRQVHALDTTLGQAKVEVMAARIRLINPDAQVHLLPLRFSAETATEILSTAYTCVVDAIDNASNKCRLIAGCRERRIPMITSGGTGGRTDPTRVRVDDLAFTSHDRLLAQVRALLRQEYGFPRGQGAFGVPCVHSTELPTPEQADRPGERRAQVVDSAPGTRFNHDPGLGTASFVTGTFGFVLASLAVRQAHGDALPDQTPVNVPVRMPNCAESPIDKAARWSSG